MLSQNCSLRISLSLSYKTATPAMTPIDVKFDEQCSEIMEISGVCSEQPDIKRKLFVKQRKKL
jgi:hypothetical protein